MINFDLVELDNLISDFAELTNVRFAESKYLRFFSQNECMVSSAWDLSDLLTIPAEYGGHVDWLIGHKFGLRISELPEQIWAPTKELLLSSFLVITDCMDRARANGHISDIISTQLINFSELREEL